MKLSIEESRPKTTTEAVILRSTRPAEFTIRPLRLPVVSLVFIPRLRRLIAFFWGSAVGLLLDLGVFAGLVACHAQPFAANLASTTVAVTVVYFVVTRYSFRVRPTAWTYTAFVLWYGTAALLVSGVVGVVGQAGEVAALLAKFGTVPVTFSANYFFGSWLFSGGAERAVQRFLVSGARRTRRKVVRACGRKGSARLRFARVEAARVESSRSVRWWQRTALVALGTTVIFAVVVLPFTTTMSFAPQSSSRGLVVEYGLRAIFLVALAAFVVFLQVFIAAVRAHSARHRVWATTAIISLCVNAAVLIAIYPGFWVWDEFYTVYVTRQYSTGAWQGYLTNVYYTFGMFLFPGPMGIVVLQLILIALVTGYVVSALWVALRRKAWVALLAVPLLSAPVLLNNLYPLRLTAYAYLLLLLLARLLVRAHRMDSARRSQPLAFIEDCLIIGILAFWRTEGIVLLALVPVVFVIRGMPALLKRDRIRGFAAILAAAALVGFAGGTTSATSDPRYQVTGIVNPLALMLQSPLTSPRMSEDLTALNRVVDVDVLREKAMVEESPALFQGGVRDDFAPHLPAFRAAYVDLILHNPGAFLSARWRTFLATNSMSGWLPQVQNAGLDHPAGRPTDAMVGFIGSNPLVTPINLTVKENVTRALLLVTSDHQMTAGAALVWNALPVIASVLLLGVFAAVRRQRMLVLVCGIVLTVAVMVFLTEPASYFMYLFPVYLAGGVIVAAAVAVAVDSRGRQSRRGLSRAGSTSAGES